MNGCFLVSFLGFYTRLEKGHQAAQCAEDRWVEGPNDVDTSLCEREREEMYSLKTNSFS